MSDRFDALTDKLKARRAPAAHPGKGWGGALGGLRDRLADVEVGNLRSLLRVGPILLILLLLYYPVGMLMTHKIDDDLAFRPSPDQITAGGSRAVDVAAALIEREVDQNGWVANTPFFMPAYPLDNMPNFQTGMVGALGRFAFEMTDQIGRARGSSQADMDLQAASGQLQYPGDKWIFDLGTSLLPTTPSDARYRDARARLIAYNQRLANGQAVFDRRSDNLLATLERVAADLGSSSAVIDEAVANRQWAVFDTTSDDLFYGIKGQVYAYAMVLDALGEDFEPIIRERGLGQVWNQMLDSFRAAAQLHPYVVVNGDPDGQVLPNHLTSMGFYLLRARTQLREVTSILLR